MWLRKISSGMVVICVVITLSFAVTISLDDLAHQVGKEIHDVKRMLTNYAVNQTVIKH